MRQTTTYLQTDFAQPVLWGTEERKATDKWVIQHAESEETDAGSGDGPTAADVDSSTCPARERGMCEEVQRSSDATELGSSWMGASSRSSMRGFLMWDSGLVRGVTLFLLIRVPGPLFTSCRTIQTSRQTPARLSSPATVLWTQTNLWALPVGVHRLHV